MTKLPIPALIIGVLFFIFVLEVSCQECDRDRCNKRYQYCCGDNVCCYTNCTNKPCDTYEYCCGINVCCIAWQHKAWPWLLIVGGAIVIFFVLAAVIYYCSVRRKRSRGYEHIDQTGAPSDYGGDDEPSEQTPLLAGGRRSPTHDPSDQQEQPISTLDAEDTPQDEDEPTPDVLVSIVDERAEYEADKEADAEADVVLVEYEKSKEEEDILQMDDVPTQTTEAKREEESGEGTSPGGPKEMSAKEQPELTSVEEQPEVTPVKEQPEEPQPDEEHTSLKEGHDEDEQTLPGTEDEDEHKVEPDDQEADKEKSPEEVPVKDMQEEETERKDETK